MTAALSPTRDAAGAVWRTGTSLHCPRQAPVQGRQGPRRAIGVQPGRHAGEAIISMSATALKAARKRPLQILV